jgi:hypothetical protein
VGRNVAEEVGRVEGVLEQSVAAAFVDDGRKQKGGSVVPREIDVGSEVSCQWEQGEEGRAGAQPADHSARPIDATARRPSRIMLWIQP